VDRRLSHLRDRATSIDLNGSDLFTALGNLVAFPRQLPSAFACALCPRDTEWLDRHLQHWALRLDADVAAPITIEFLRLSGQYDDAIRLGKQYLEELNHRYKAAPSPEQLVRLLSLNNHIGRALLDRGNASGKSDDYGEAYGFIDWAFTIEDQIYDYGEVWSEELTVLEDTDGRVNLVLCHS
jgi:tetratricopeptide (TPR) repeat protein